MSYYTSLDYLRRLKSGSDIANAFGYSTYGDYFSPLDQDLNRMSKPEYWDAYAQPFKQYASNTYQSNVGGLRSNTQQSLLQQILNKYNMASKSGFSGAGSYDYDYNAGTNLLRKNYGREYTSLGDAYNKQLYNIGLDVLDKRTGVQDKINSWYDRMLEIARSLNESDAKRSETNPYPYNTPEWIQWERDHGRGTPPPPPPSGSNLSTPTGTSSTRVRTLNPNSSGTYPLVVGPVIQSDPFGEYDDRANWYDNP